MSLESVLQNAFTRVGTEFKQIRIILSGSGTGNASALQTSATNIVAAINEVLDIANNAGTGSGDMLKSTYDPNGKNADAFARSNMTGTQTVSTISDFTSAVNGLLQQLIDDETPSTTKAYSSSKVESRITAAITAALEGEDLSDLADAIAQLQITDAGLVSASKVQSFTTPQKQQARDNINVWSKDEIGNINTDFVAVFEAAIA